MAPVVITLNVDAGELPDEPVELYDLADAVNVACGGHAGDETSMCEAIARCLAHGTTLGAHPSYPDREGFGRRTLAIEPFALFASIEGQLRALEALARASEALVAHVKPHGALYHDVDRDPALAHGLVRVAKDVLGAVAIVGPSVRAPGRGALAEAAREAGLVYVREGFCDRAMRTDGSLVPRGDPGASIDDPARAADQAHTLATSGAYETLCVHGDGAHAVAIARAVAARLRSIGVARRS